MRFVFDHDLHIHSQLSACSDDPAQNPQRILDYARENGLTTLCLTDHYWDAAVPGASRWYKPQDFDHISQAKPLPQGENTRFLFGCETDMDKFFTLGIPRERFDDFDFVIIPTTHLHMMGFTLTEADGASPATRAKLWVRRLEALLAMDLPWYKIGIAHLACPLICNGPREDYLQTISLIPEADMQRLFTKAARLGVGIELNPGEMKCTDEEADTVLRMFRIAKGCGCKFYCGSDAHHPAGLDKAKAIFELAIDRLGLEESDKFRI